MEHGLQAQLAEMQTLLGTTSSPLTLTTHC
jgi:hypothetical protein